VSTGGACAVPPYPPTSDLSCSADSAFRSAFIVVKSRTRSCDSIAGCTDVSFFVLAPAHGHRSVGRTTPANAASTHSIPFSDLPLQVIAVPIMLTFKCGLTSSSDRTGSVQRSVAKMQLLHPLCADRDCSPGVRTGSVSFPFPAEACGLAPCGFGRGLGSGGSCAGISTGGMRLA